MTGLAALQSAHFAYNQNEHTVHLSITVGEKIKALIESREGEKTLIDPLPKNLEHIHTPEQFLRYLPDATVTVLEHEDGSLVIEIYKSNLGNYPIALSASAEKLEQVANEAAIDPEEVSLQEAPTEMSLISMDVDSRAIVSAQSEVSEVKDSSDNSTMSLAGKVAQKPFKWVHKHFIKGSPILDPYHKSAPEPKTEPNSIALALSTRNDPSIIENAMVILHVTEESKNNFQLINEHYKISFDELSNKKGKANPYLAAQLFQPLIDDLGIAYTTLTGQPAYLN